MAYHISGSSKYAIMLSPVVLTVLCTVLLMIPPTQKFTLWMLEENHPVELLTFAAALYGGILGLNLAFRLRKQGENAWLVGFYGLFAVALIVVAMEEVAWGQKLFGFDTPEFWRSINRQGETTLHNLGGLQGHSEIFRIVFGLGGLIGIGLSIYPFFRSIAVPMMLLPWFVIITLHASLDIYNDYFPIERQFDHYVQRTSELVELFIVISGLLYVVLNSRMLLMALRSGSHLSDPIDATRPDR